MNTWSCSSYAVSIRADIFLDYISLRIDETTGMPYVSKCYPCEWKEVEDITEGDIAYCINGIYFTTTSDIDNQTRILKEILDTGKRFSLKFISVEQYTKNRVPRIEQIILPTKLEEMVLGSFATGITSCIMSLPSAMYSSLAGSALLAVNDEVVVNKTKESIELYLHSLVSPIVLLITCPFQQSPITPWEINKYLSNNSILTSNRPTNTDDVPRLFAPTVSAPDLSEHQSRIAESFVNQLNYTNRPYAVDIYMFPQSQGYSILERQWIESNKQRWDRNEANWKSFLETIGGVEKLNFSWTRQSGKRWGIPLGTASCRRNQLHSLIHEGIPYSLRPQVWYYLSGGYELKTRSVNSYEQLWKSQTDSSIQSIIESDLPRTFPSHPLFSQGTHIKQENEKSPRELIKEEAPFISSLRRMLLGISVIRDDIEYCQGMNILAGWILLVTMDEEMAFWTLAALLQFSFPENYFDFTLSGIRTDELVFESIVKKQFPQLAKRIENYDEKLLTVSFSWFMKLFISSLPIITVARIWDILIMEGDKTILRVATALIALNEKSLLSIEDDCNFATALKNVGILQFDVDELFKLAFAINIFPYKREEIQIMRREKRKDIKTCLDPSKDELKVIDSDDE